MNGNNNGNGNQGGGNPHLDNGGVPGNGVPSMLDGTPPGHYQDGGVGPGGVPGLLGGTPPGHYEPEPEPEIPEGMVEIPTEPSEEQYEALLDTELADPFELKIQVVDEEGDPFTGQITEEDHGNDEFFWVTDHLGEFDETPENRYGAHFEMDFDEEGYTSILLGNHEDADVNYLGMDVNSITESIDFRLDELGEEFENLEVARMFVEKANDQEAVNITGVNEAMEGSTGDMPA